MPTYLSPGVYVEEVDRGSKPIEGVGTAVAAFVGFTARAPNDDPNDPDGIKPRLVTNWAQFESLYGGFVEGAMLPHAVYGYFNNGGGTCYIVPDPAHVRRRRRAEPGAAVGRQGRAPDARGPGARCRRRARGRPSSRPRPPRASSRVDVHAEGPRGRPRGRVVRRPHVRQGQPQRRDGRQRRVEVRPGRRPQGERRDARRARSRRPAATRSRPGRSRRSRCPAGTSPDRRPTAPASTAWPSPTTSPWSSSPTWSPPPPRTDGSLDLELWKAVQTALITHCEQHGNRMAILDAPPGMTPQQIKEWRADVAMYDSRVRRAVLPVDQGREPDRRQRRRRDARSRRRGHIAGVWARTDETRGVWKAPANDTIRGASTSRRDVTKNEQDLLNPIGINCIRPFGTRGIRDLGRSHAVVATPTGATSTSAGCST